MVELRSSLNRPLRTPLHYVIRSLNLPFHDDEEAFVAVVAVLVDVVDVDNVLAVGRAPVQLDLASKKHLKIN